MQVNTKIESLNEQIEKNKRRHGTHIQEIREDADLNADAKRRRIQEVHQEAATKHSELFGQKKAEITTDMESKRRAAFAPPSISGADKASLAMSYRDSLDRVSKVDSDEGLREVLNRAQLTGDAVLAKAVLYRGYELESEGAVGAYLETYPAAQRGWDEFMEAAQVANELERQEQMFGSLAPEKPRELDSPAVRG